LGGSTIVAGPLRGALQPLEDGLGVADRRAQPDALHVVPGEPGDPLDHAQEVRAAVGAGQRVDLVDDHHPQVGEQAWRVSIFSEISITSSDSGVVISSSAGSRRKVRRSWLVVSPCHTKRRRPDHLGVGAQALGLVVEQAP
jgi:hypothetical protein